MEEKLSFLNKSIKNIQEIQEIQKKSGLLRKFNKLMHNESD